MNDEREVIIPLKDLSGLKFEPLDREPLIREPFIAGLKPLEGTWRKGGIIGPFEPVEPVRRHVRINPHTVRLFGVDWFAGVVLEFDGDQVVSASEPEDGMVEYGVSMQPENVVVIPPALWRKAGYYLFAKHIGRVRDWWHAEGELE
jgi:hypothetical protein